MAVELKELFKELELGEVVEAEGLRVVGLKWRPERELGYQTLDEGLAAGTLTITEVSEGGSVPNLVVQNSSDSMVLLISGEQLVGAKQNRIVNTSVMVAAKSKTLIPVSCVEQGRWAYKSRAFQSGGNASHYQLRKVTSRSVSKSRERDGSAESDQGAVWREVGRKLHCMSSSSGSDALHQAFIDHEAKLNEIASKVQSVAGCNGAVFIIGDQIAGMDLFDSPATFAKVLPKLARAYGIDALERSPSGQEPPAEAAKEPSWWPWKRGTKDKAEGAPDVKAWLAQTAGAEFQRFASAGLGDDIRISSNDLVGGGLVVDDQPVHVELFAE